MLLQDRTCIIERETAYKILAADEYDNISKEDRELIIHNEWGLNETDEEFAKLPIELQKELLAYNEPQEDCMSPQYDELVKAACEFSYIEWLNEELADAVSEVFGEKVEVTGINPDRYKCPCCGKMSLSTRGEYDICVFCKWEDDCWEMEGQEREERYSGVNHMTLKQARSNYLKYGIIYHPCHDSKTELLREIK